jgi:uncharacterized membrane protein
MNLHRRASKWAKRLTLALLVLAILVMPALALAGPRSGGSFGGRLGFRSPGGGFGSAPSRSYYGGGSSYYGGGPSYHIFPGFGWGWGGYGYGGGFGLVGTVLTLVVVGVAVASIARAVRASRRMGPSDGGWTGYADDEADVMPDRAYVYKLQLALGRSARGVQDRLAEFAARGDTSTESGLATLLQQTALELLREKDSVRYGAAEARGPMSFTNAETAMNGVALAERSRFQVERVRVVDGRTIRSDAPAEEGREALELIVVTLVVATRTPLPGFGGIDSPDDLAKLLTTLGGVSPDGLLGLEVVWTPADPNDSMTETDVMTTYPELRSV